MIRNVLTPILLGSLMSLPFATMAAEDGVGRIGQTGHLNKGSLSASYFMCVLSKHNSSGKTSPDWQFVSPELCMLLG